MAVILRSGRPHTGLAFVAAGANRVDLGGSVPIYQIHGATLALVHPVKTASGSEQYIYHRGTTAAALNLFLRFVGASGGIRCGARGSTLSNQTALFDAFTNFSFDRLAVVGHSWVLGGAALEQRLLYANHDTPLHEPRGYTSQTAPAGTVPTETGVVTVIGNSSSSSPVNAFNGSILALVHVPGVYNLAKLKHIAEQLLWHQPLNGLGLHGLWYPGKNQAGTVYDESDNGANGTITGASYVLGYSPPSMPRRRRLWPRILGGSGYVPAVLPFTKIQFRPAAG